jgi:hypothetical protein
MYNDYVPELYSDFDPKIIKSSIEYYDSFQPRINSILNKIEYIELINNNNITDQIVFYDKNKKIILRSSYECLSYYLPSENIWKWSWSVPYIAKKYTYITRKLIDYAVGIETYNDAFIKNILVNSKIIIKNDIQLDILLALFSKLSKKPFILKYPHLPIDENNLTNEKYNNLISYKEIINNKKYKDYKGNLVEYLIILDFE